MMPGETVYSGAEPECPACGGKLSWRVMKTCAWAVWTFCASPKDWDCEGPYSRETGYFETEAEAENALLRIQAGDFRDTRS